MRLSAMMFLAVSACLFGAAGCTGVESEQGDSEQDDSETDGPISTAASPQVDENSSVYTIAQSGVTTASAWAGPIGAGTPVEYWVAKPTYSASAARTLTAAPQSCSSWKSAVCGSGWTGATYYKAVYTEITLDCAFPPDPCRAPTNATAFLGAGTYQTVDSGGAGFAWTHVAGKCEYWAMHHTISTGSNTQSPLSSPYSSLGAFETAVCAMNPVPTTWYTVHYVPVANFCSVSTC